MRGGEGPGLAGMGDIHKFQAVSIRVDLQMIREKRKQRGLHVHA